MSAISYLLLSLLPVAILMAVWAVFLLVNKLRRVPFRPMPTGAVINTFDPTWITSGVAAIAFSMVYAASSSLVRRQAVEGALRTGVVLLPVPLLIWFLIAWGRVIRRGDELERRLQLEGAGYALGTFMTFMMLSALLDRLWGGYPYADMWAFLPLYYWVGLMLAKLRYLGGGEK